MNLLVRKNRPGDNHFIEIPDFFQSLTIIINRAQSVSPITLPRPLTRFPTFVIISPVELLIHDCVPAQLLLVVFRASCRVAIVFFTRLKLIWPRSNLKATKVSRNAFLTKSSRGQWVKTSIFLVYFRDSGKRNLDFRDPWFPIFSVREPCQRPPLYDPQSWILSHWELLPQNEYWEHFSASHRKWAGKFHNTKWYFLEHLQSCFRRILANV